MGDLEQASRHNVQLSVEKCDVELDAEEVTYRLVSLGHQRIGFIVGDTNQVACERRLSGYRDTLHEAGLPAPKELVAQGLFTYRSGLNAAEQLLGLETIPTAIFASNDDMAAATVAVTHRYGLDVPGDLSVCGFDDTALAATIWPDFTTIHQPIIEMYLAAVDLLIKKIRAPRAGAEDESAKDRTGWGSNLLLQSGHPSVSLISL
ncbi:MAG: substrate-binding domain-containing protein [Exilibacterium sp.]